MSSIPLVFVFGTGRCGTHTTWKVFESLPNTFSTHEGYGLVRAGPPALLGKKVSMGCMPEFNAYLYHYASEDIFRRTFDPDSGMTALMDVCFTQRSTSIAWCETHAIAYCDANPFAYNFINYLHTKFPRAKFIHLVRDGYACVRSWSRRDSTYPDRPADLRALSWILAKPTPYPSEPEYSSWTTFDRLQRISWFWNNVNANITERFTRIPAANKMVLKIEDVTEKTLPGILEFCGLPQQFSPDSLTPGDPSRGPSIEWTPENVKKFNDLAAPMMDMLGYGLR